MKIYVSENIDKAIQGFTIVPIVYGEVDLSKIPDNGATTIVAIDALDTILPDKVNPFINLLCTKLRLNGSIHIGGLDPNALSRSLVSGNIEIDEFNKSISNKEALYPSKYITELLRLRDLTILSVIYRGNYYEISAQRTKN